MTVAALYIDPRGPYPKMADVDCWDEQRDARLYDGPWPVVAHPPCGPWGRLRHMSRRPQDRHLFAVALWQVRTWGGVLEHPAGSRAWDRFGLPRPGDLPDAYGGVTIKVNQCDWGHVARKPIWLYLVGVHDVGQLPPSRDPTHWIGGFRTGDGGRPTSTYRRNGRAIPPGIKACSAQQRRRTPPAFAEWLVSLAEQAASQRSGAV